MVEHVRHFFLLLSEGQLRRGAHRVSAGDTLSAGFLDHLARCCRAVSHRHLAHAELLLQLANAIRIVLCRLAWVGGARPRRRGASRH